MILFSEHYTHCPNKCKGGRQCNMELYCSSTHWSFLCQDIFPLHWRFINKVGYKILLLQMPVDLSTYAALTSLPVSALKTAEQQPGFSGSSARGELVVTQRFQQEPLFLSAIPLLHLSGKPKCVMHEMFAPLVSKEVELALWCSWGYQGMCCSKQYLLGLPAKERSLSFFGCAFFSVQRGKHDCQLGRVKRFQVDSLHPSVLRACY